MRQIGIQPPASRGRLPWRPEDAQRVGAKLRFGNETRFFLNVSLGFDRTTDVRRDVFHLPAMGLWQIPAQFECLLANLHRLLASRPLKGRTVTIGTWSGWTDLIIAAHMQRLNPDSRHTTFDIRNHVSDCVVTLFEYHGVKRVRNGWFGGNESWRPLGLLSQYDGAYPAKWRVPVLDFCFVDGGHSYYHANRDFRTMRTACDLIAFHDIVNRDVGWREQPLLWRHLTNESHARFASEFEPTRCTQQPVKDGGQMGIGILSRKGIGIAPEE